MRCERTGLFALVGRGCKEEKEGEGEIGEGLGEEEVTMRLVGRICYIHLFLLYIRLVLDWLESDMKLP